MSDRIVLLEAVAQAVRNYLCIKPGLLPAEEPLAEALARLDEAAAGDGCTTAATMQREVNRRHLAEKMTAPDRTTDERSEIAEWIRSGACIDWELDEIADAIERGAHAQPDASGDRAGPQREGE